MHFTQIFQQRQLPSSIERCLSLDFRHCLGFLHLGFFLTGDDDEQQQVEDLEDTEPAA